MIKEINISTKTSHGKIMKLVSFLPFPISLYISYTYRSRISKASNVKNSCFKLFMFQLFFPRTLIRNDRKGSVSPFYVERPVKKYRVFAGTQDAEAPP